MQAQQLTQRTCQDHKQKNGSPFHKFTSIGYLAYSDTLQDLSYPQYIPAPEQQGSGRQSAAATAQQQQAKAEYEQNARETYTSWLEEYTNLANAVTRTGEFVLQLQLKRADWECQGGVLALALDTTCHGPELPAAW